MDSRKHAKFSGDTASISRKVGGKIMAYGGYITGTNVELVQNKTIVRTGTRPIGPKTTNPESRSASS